MAELRKRGRPPLGDKRKPQPMRILVALPPDLHAALRSYCRGHKLAPDMGSVMRLALREFLDREAST